MSRELKAKHSEIPWRDVAGMRNKLIHAYFGVKLELVWETVKHKPSRTQKANLQHIREDQ